MKKHTCVSVIIPIYNKRDYLLRSIESVLAQTHTDFELILVDDGSTDGSLDTVWHLDDPRIRRIQQQNAGVSEARNTGVKLARSPLVAFLDADDTWEPEFLESMMALRTQYPDAGLYASGYAIKVPGEEAKPARITGMPLLRRQFSSRGYFHMSAGGELPITASSVVIPRHILLAVGGFPADENMGEDQHVWWQICAQHEFAYDRRVLATYHRDATNRACPAILPSKELPFSEHLREALPTLGLSAWQRLHAHRYIGGHLLHLARENMRAGRSLVATSLLRDWRTRLLPVKWMFRQLQIQKRNRMLTQFPA
ncbi:MAG: glycosyltransferase family 2 protein [Pseudomonadota bacterium]